MPMTGRAMPPTLQGAQRLPDEPPQRGRRGGRRVQRPAAVRDDPAGEEHAARADAFTRAQRGPQARPGARAPRRPGRGGTGMPGPRSTCSSALATRRRVRHDVTWRARRPSSGSEAGSAPAARALSRRGARRTTAKRGMTAADSAPPGARIHPVQATARAGRRSTVSAIRSYRSPSRSASASTSARTRGIQNTSAQSVPRTAPASTSLG